MTSGRRSYYDIDAIEGDDEIIEELMAAETFICLDPTLSPRPVIVATSCSTSSGRARRPESRGGRIRWIIGVMRWGL